MAGDGDVLRILAGGEWARKLKWPPRGPPTTSWDGVQEVENGRVTKLWLFNKGLTGEIPKELGDLANLQKLDLSYNKLTGSIPRELGQLQELHHLWLYGNQLTGSIPKELGELRNLQDLYLYNNQLEGSIPTELGQLQKLANLNLSNNQLTDNPGDLSGREAVARWQDSLASRQQQIDSDRRRSEQAAEALRLQQEADRLRESRAAAAAAAEAERVAREAAEAEARRKQDLFRQQELQRLRDEETQRRDTIEPWLRDAGFASDMAAAFGKRFKDEHVATPLAVQSLSRDKVLGLARKFGMHENLVDLLVAALDKAVAAEKQRIAEEAAANTRAAAAERQRLADEAAGSSMGQWLTELGFFGKAGQWTLELSEKELHTPDEVVEMASDDSATLQQVLEEMKMPSVLRSKLTRGIDEAIEHAKQAVARETAQREAEAKAEANAAAAREEARLEEQSKRKRAAAAASEAEAARQQREVQEEAERRRERELDAARTSDLAVWLQQEGGFALDQAAELSLRLAKSGVGGKRFLQLLTREKVERASADQDVWGMTSEQRDVFLALWERLKAGPPVSSNLSDNSGLQDERFGRETALWDAGGTSRGYVAPVLANSGITATTVYVKKLPSPQQTRAFERECAMLRYLNEKRVSCVPRLHAEPKRAAADGEYHSIIMERGNKNLRQVAEEFLKSSPSKAELNSQLVLWTMQMLRIIHDLHALGVVWADLKPENFVLSSPEEHGRNGELLAVDFGSCAVKAFSTAAFELSSNAAVQTTVSLAAGQAFTAAYSAPELARCLRDGRECKADTALDMWSLGMVLFWLVTGNGYFSSNDATTLKDLSDPDFAVDLSRLRPHVWSTRLLRRLLHVDPSVRASALDAREVVDSGRSIVSKSVIGSMRIVERQQAAASEAQAIQEQLESAEEKHASGDVERLTEMLNLALEKLERIDRSRRLIHELVRDELKCPRVFILLPADKSLWSVPKRWFGTPMRLHFLCAFGHPSARPCNDGEGFEVLHPRQWVKDHAAALQASLAVVKLAAGVALTAATSGAASLLPLNAVFAALDFSALGFDAIAVDEAISELGSLGQEKFVAAVDSAMCNQLDNGDSGASTRKEIHNATGASYRSIVQFLDDNHHGWKAKLGDLSMQVSEHDDEAAWVCAAHSNAWRQSTSISRKASPPSTALASTPAPASTVNAAVAKLESAKASRSCCSTS